MNLELLRRKLALGTVQLGLSYGINNKDGRPNQSEASQILDAAAKWNINMLDSAEAYGDSLQVIGRYLNDHVESKFEIVSKFIDDGHSVRKKFEATIQVLNRNDLYAFMYHRFIDYQTGKGIAELLQLREEGRIKMIGVSVYDTEELKLVIDDPEIGLIQVPYNLFDASKEKKRLLTSAKSRGQEIHTRSIFLQGLFFKKPEELTGNLRGLIAALQAFHKIRREHNLTVMQACLNYALHNSLIDRVIIGVDKSAQLEQNLEALLEHFPEELSDAFESIVISERTLLNPSKWKP